MRKSIKQVYTVANEIRPGDLIELSGPPLAEVVRVQKIHVGRQATDWDALHIQTRPIEPLPEDTYFIIRFPHEAVTIWRPRVESNGPALRPESEAVEA